MKKNLRIVSAAAAALLAVAPVAASAVSVNAADNTTVNATNSTSDYSHINLGGTTISNNTVANVNPSFALNSAVTKNGALTPNDTAQVVQDGGLTGSISATALGVTATANLFNGQNGASTVEVTAKDNTSDVIYKQTTGTDGKTQTTNNFKKVVVGNQYTVTVNNVGFNFGANNAGKEVTLTLPQNTPFSFTGTLPSGWTPVTTTNGNVTAIKGKLDNNGTVSNLQLKGNLTALNPENNNNVVFYDVENGSSVKDGNVMVLADYNKQLNVDSIMQAIFSKYTAMQRIESRNGNVQDGAQNVLDFAKLGHGIKLDTSRNDIIKQLENAGIKVSPAGYFTAPHSFKATVKVVSNINGKSKELPVTFTVANVADPVVPSQSKTIMHNAYYYKEDGTTRANNDKAKRYESVTVAMSTKKIGNKDFYEVIKDGKATGMYINADNIDGTKRTLKHNAYVYKTSKKRANKVVLKKGDTVVTYGGTYTFKNGKQYYKINNNTEKTYVKASNF
ncbi:S-layer protein [Lactobacillus crispatus]|uniref:SLAP domain-containing protein n=1 Tax=Lactobacillus TaxID=1578 RepID=UPI000B5D9A0E|nr:MULTISPECIES: SLAP domain-containing protein [Lactobacillus]OXC46998.1 S-layer protein [Lactobacillus crispatus]OXC47851.1 S-layer protein [Lactobacillus crispatus]OXC51278.1 S-layer protein [Lactobacillus crispatus]OXC52281.1 S-layer protein [Lactobacillus crispatus]OXC54919.1 S-layer protein [Lactobacillus crispatus]